MMHHGQWGRFHLGAHHISFATILTARYRFANYVYIFYHFSISSVSLFFPVSDIVWTLSSVAISNRNYWNNTYFLWSLDKDLTHLYLMLCQCNFKLCSPCYWSLALLDGCSVFGKFSHPFSQYSHYIFKFRWNWYSIRVCLTEIYTCIVESGS